MVHLSSSGESKKEGRGDLAIGGDKHGLKIEEEIDGISLRL